MALNAASHNPSRSKDSSACPHILNGATAGEPTGSVSGPPPPTSGETLAAIQNAESQDSLGQSQGGKDAGSAIENINPPAAEGKPKSAKESMSEPESV